MGTMRPRDWQLGTSRPFKYKIDRIGNISPSSPRHLRTPCVHSAGNPMTPALLNLTETPTSFQSRTHENFPLPDGFLRSRCAAHLRQAFLAEDKIYHVSGFSRCSALKGWERSCFGWPVQRRRATGSRPTQKGVRKWLEHLDISTRRIADLKG